MDSAASEAPLMARERDTDESRCHMALLPPETKIQIMSYISTQQSLSRLAQSCGAWYGPATQELYTRDAKRHRSFAIKWMAAHAVDEQTTDFALKTLETSRRWGGQINPAYLPIWMFRSEDQKMYEKSTALHFAVFLGNLRLTKTLLDMEASLEVPCSNRLWESMGSEEFLRRVSYFLSAFRDIFRHIFSSDGRLTFDRVFPIFLAFLRRDVDMCKLLVEHGSGREAMIVSFRNMSILHFAAADPTTDYRHWQWLFDRFREYIDEPCPVSRCTPLHVALIQGCTQGMQIAVESGADKEARDGDSRTPLSIGVLGILAHTSRDARTPEERMVCFRKFVELGASVNPEGDSVLLHAVRSYAPCASSFQGMRQLIYFLLEHHADIHATSRSQDTNLINEIVRIVQSVIRRCPQDHKTEAFLKRLLGELVDRGLNLKTSAPGLPSPLYRVLQFRNAKPEWLFDLLCEKGAMIHDSEVGSAFLCWCKTRRLWERNQYDAWWQHQGQEDEMFLKWCEHPYNVWWWRHVKHISPDVFLMQMAYRAAFEYEDRKLYDVLTHLPLPPPSDDLFVNMASESCQTWSWRQVMQCGFEDDFVATWRCFFFEDNMIHVTVHKYIDIRFCYAAAEAIQDIMYLRGKGVDITSCNKTGKTSLDILLESDRSRDGFMEVAAVLDGKVHKVQELPTGLRAQ